MFALICSLCKKLVAYGSERVEKICCVSCVGEGLKKQDRYAEYDEVDEVLDSEILEEKDALDG